MVGREDDRPLRGHVLAPDPREAEVEVAERLQDGPRRASTRSGSRPARGRAGAAPRRSMVRRRTHAPRGTLQCAHGPRAAPGRCAARSLAPPRRACGRRSSRWTSACSACPTTTSSCSALRSVRGRAEIPVGTAIHLLNGALFGAVYANVAPALPVPPWARGPLAGLAEHLATWPLASVVDRVHPARDRIPPITGKRAAFAQAAWRHLLFGLLLGELERRLNAPEPEVRLARGRLLLQRARLARARHPRRLVASPALGRAPVITGASGFAGGHLADACATAGDSIVALSRADGRRPPRRRRDPAGDRRGPAGRRLPPRRAGARSGARGRTRAGR